MVLLSCRYCDTTLAGEIYTRDGEVFCHVWCADAYTEQTPPTSIITSYQLDEVSTYYNKLLVSDKMWAAIAVVTCKETMDILGFEFNERNNAFQRKPFSSIFEDKEAIEDIIKSINCTKIKLEARDND